MAMGSGGPGGLSSDINVTPLIDVLLVLLIIFMVIVPVTPKGLDALVPQPPKTPQTENPDAIVVQVVHSLTGGITSYKINETDVTNEADLRARLTAIFSTRADRVMFVKGDKSLDFAEVAQVMDVGRSANVDHIGLITGGL